VALDVPRAANALELARRLDPALCRVKVGKELFTAAGPAVVRDLCALGFTVFLDLKFHDIPNTVAGACRAAADLGCWMVNVHAAGGPRMLAQARAALGDGPTRPLLIAVTVLTSFDRGELRAVGVIDDVDVQVSRLAALAAAAGADGVVCSPLEIARLRAEQGDDFVLVTPGVRPPRAAVDDQLRVATPAAALGAGAHYLVIGRPITQAPDPGVALAAIARELASAARA
jgi:orotidine-5'-phosphate decarboxylase